MDKPFSAEEYYATQLPPESLEQDVSRVKEFIETHRKTGRRIAFVTVSASQWRNNRPARTQRVSRNLARDGGASADHNSHVRNCSVRFLDNFSAGTRGATSAEYFLKHSYAVIFMHRQYSLQPFSRHYSHTLNPFLDFLDISPGLSSTSSDADPTITVKEDKRTQLMSVLSTYKEVQRLGTLLSLTFVTVDDYLFMLRGITKELSVMGGHVIYYLAAAVSDFFLPKQKMSEHKIQSGKGNLQIEMDQVPKILMPLVNEWTPHSFIVSFKLETDPSILIPKARSSLERYGHTLVIGNLLNTRKYEVVLVARKSLINSISNVQNSAEEGLSKGGKQFVEQWLRLAKGKVEIEEALIEQLIAYHDAWIRSHATGSSLE